MTSRPAPVPTKSVEPINAVPPANVKPSKPVRPALWHQPTTTNITRLKWMFQVHDDLSLAPLTLRVAAVICDHVSLKEGYAWPTIPTITRRLQCTERAVQQAINQLEDGGHLTVERTRGRGRSNRYYLHGKVRLVSDRTGDEGA